MFLFCLSLLSSDVEAKVNCVKQVLTLKLLFNGLKNEKNHL